MNRTADAMTAEISHDLKTTALGLPLHGSANIVNAVSGARCPCSLIESSFGATRQRARGCANLAYTDCDGGIGIEAAFFGNQVELYQIPRSDHARARNPVDGFVINANTERSWKAVNLGWRRLGPIIGQCARADFVQFPGCDAGPHRSRSRIERLTHDASDYPELL
jgi:hypothetical protein